MKKSIATENPQLLAYQILCNYLEKYLNMKKLILK